MHRTPLPTHPREPKRHRRQPAAARAATLAAALAAALLAGPATAAGAPPPGSRWITESGNLEVELGPCGDAFCGTVVKVLANRSMSAPGQAMDPADARPALGMVILSGFLPAGEGEWKGEIYNRENGKRYSARITLPADDQLVIRAYVGLPMFGKTQVWRRATGTGTENAAATAAGATR